MEKKNYTVVTLEAADGMWITQAEAVGAEERVLTKKVFLAATDTVENWREVDEAEAEAYRKEAELARTLREAQEKARLEAEEAERRAAEEAEMAAAMGGNEAEEVMVEGAEIADASGGDIEESEIL